VAVIVTIGKISLVWKKVGCYRTLLAHMHQVKEREEEELEKPVACSCAKIDA